MKFCEVKSKIIITRSIFQFIALCSLKFHNIFIYILKTCETRKPKFHKSTLHDPSYKPVFPFTKRHKVNKVLHFPKPLLQNEITGNLAIKTIS